MLKKNAVPSRCLPIYQQRKPFPLPTKNNATIGDSFKTAFKDDDDDQWSTFSFEFVVDDAIEQDEEEKPSEIRKTFLVDEEVQVRNESIFHFVFFFDEKENLRSLLASGCFFFVYIRIRYHHRYRRQSHLLAS